MPKKTLAKIATLSRRVQFAASHRMHNPNWSAKKNVDTYGKCNHANGHGHNYELEVVLKGEIDSETGMVFNLTDLKKIIESQIMSAMDHKNLNLDIPEFKTLIPTAENIAVVIWDRLAKKLPAGLLNEVRLRETENNLVSYRGENA